MRKLLVLVATVVAGLALAGVAQAGCMATVGLDSMPKAGLAAGEPWIVRIRVLQHGRRPMPDAKPEVRIRNAAGKLFVFKTTKTPRVGSYRARVVFPKAGRYSLGVYDGFVTYGGAQTHTFKPVQIGAPADSFPYLPLGIAAALALALAAATTVVWRRRAHEPATVRKLKEAA